MDPSATTISLYVGDSLNLNFSANVPDETFGIASESKSPSTGSEYTDSLTTWYRFGGVYAAYPHW